MSSDTSDWRRGAAQMSVDTASCKPGSSSLFWETERGIQGSALQQEKSSVYVCSLLQCSLHRLNEAKASQQQVAVKLQDLHGFYQIVLSDDVLHTDPCPLILSRWKIISNLLPCLLSKLSFILHLWCKREKRIVITGRNRTAFVLQTRSSINYKSTVLVFNSELTFLFLKEFESVDDQPEVDS